MEIIQSSNQINRDIAAKIATTYNLTWQERVFYETLRSYKGNEDHTAWPSINTIAKTMGVCRNTAKRYIGQLVDKGIIWLEERKITLGGRVWNDTHMYTFIAEKHGEAKKQKVKGSIEQSETGYQRTKREFTEAKKELSLTYPSTLCEKAFKEAIGNIRAGVTTHIKKPLAYMKQIIKSMQEDNESAKAQKEFADSIEIKAPEKKKEQSNYKPVAKKTNFHNFEQRTSNYSNADIEAMIRKKQE